MGISSFLARRDLATTTIIAIVNAKTTTPSMDPATAPTTVEPDEDEDGTPMPTITSFGMYFDELEMGFVVVMMGKVSDDVGFIVTDVVAVNAGEV